METDESNLEPGWSHRVGQLTPAKLDAEMPRVKATYVRSVLASTEPQLVHGANKCASVVDILPLNAGSGVVSVTFKMSYNTISKQKQRFRYTT